jgi:hypothetical protein
MTGAENVFARRATAGVLGNAQPDIVVAEIVAAFTHEDKGGVLLYPQFASRHDEAVILVAARVFVTDRRKPAIHCVLRPHRACRLTDGNRLSDPPNG